MFSSNCNQVFQQKHLNSSVNLLYLLPHLNCPKSSQGRGSSLYLILNTPMPGCISYLIQFLPLPLNYTSKPKKTLIEKMSKSKERLNQGLLVLSSVDISCEGKESRRETPFFVKPKRLYRCITCLQPLPSHSISKETTEHNFLCSQHAASLEHYTLQGRTMKHHRN